MDEFFKKVNQKVTSGDAQHPMPACPLEHRYFKGQIFKTHPKNNMFSKK